MFNDDLIQKIAKKGTDHAYNANLDSAVFYADSLEKYIPNHPVVQLIKAIALLWYTISYNFQRKF